jgi:hypothetical protein
MLRIINTPARTVQKGDEIRIGRAFHRVWLIACNGRRGPTTRIYYGPPGLYAPLIEHPDGLVTIRHRTLT